MVGNKADLEEERRITKEEGLKYKEEQNLDLFMETSAKTGLNIKNVLIEAAKILYKDSLDYMPVKKQEKKSMDVVDKKKVLYFNDLYYEIQIKKSKNDESLIISVKPEDCDSEKFYESKFIIDAIFKNIHML